MKEKLTLKDFHYELPEELIAQTPLPNREMSRLMLVDKKTGKTEHRIFKDITACLEPGDCLVLNNTRVIPARLLGEKEGSGGKIEFLLLDKVGDDLWEVILKPGKKATPGARFVFGNGLMHAEVVEIVEEGKRRVKFEYEGIFEEVLDQIGIIPLPPYITEELEDKERYQTVYSKVKGSAAAPTAGLHFTQELLQEISDKGINIVYLTLHVGLGTFRPVSSDDITKHKMHAEYYEIDAETCDVINQAKKAGKRVICIGTTVCRVLETAGTAVREQAKTSESDASEPDVYVKPMKGMTDIFIYPGYEFKVVDTLITNFHLPGSTLVMMISAFCGRDNIMGAYEEAVKERYRFFSFGDAMMLTDFREQSE